MKNNRRFAAGLALGLTLVSGLAAGCGGGDGVSGVPVQGSVLYNGKPVSLGQGEQLEVRFVLLEPGKQVSAAATYNSGDGTFKVAGPASRGIPEGKYRVAVTTNDYERGPKSKGDRFGGKFGPSNSPLTFTLSSANADKVVVDVGKGSVSVK